LEDISKNLDELEPIIEAEKKVHDIDHDTGYEQLEKAQGILSKLQVEKSRLLLAVQACEAAKACISRPSSPMENFHQMIPEKELMVRARLDDAIDDVS
jgi:nesprin-1